MRRGQFLWLILIYLFLFILGYWPVGAKKGRLSSRTPVYSIPVTLWNAPAASKDS
ncbi:MAG TPA: hypothetical protein VMU88_02630 [bacterium]|nr:hypothetical protein [bacterium]